MKKINKYKLINLKTKEETLCDKVTIGGFDYYMSDKFIEEGDFAINLNTKHIKQYDGVKGMDSYWKKVIATNNPNLDIQKVVDEVEMLAYENCQSWEHFGTAQGGFIKGYNKAKEQFSNSDEDMVEFHKWLLKEQWFYHAKYNEFNNPFGEIKTTKELLQHWKSQQPITLYYGL